MAKPKDIITSNQAFEIILLKQPLKNLHITGQFNLSGLDNFDKPVIIDNCVFENLEGSLSQFLKEVKISNSYFKKCQFAFSYFLGGLEIDHCVFDNYLDFQAGGHNKNGKAILIDNSTFKNFVNFFDCWYESAVIIKNNDFQKGTNLLGRPDNLFVTFEVDPIIENNSGQLDCDNEGDLTLADQ